MSYFQGTALFPSGFLKRQETPSYRVKAFNDSFTLSGTWHFYRTCITTQQLLIYTGFPTYGRHRSKLLGLTQQCRYCQSEFNSIVAVNQPRRDIFSIRDHFGYLRVKRVNKSLLQSLQSLVGAYYHTKPVKRPCTTIVFISPVYFNFYKFHKLSICRELHISYE